MNSESFNAGVDLMLDSFGQTMETLLLLGQDIILNEMVFGGDVNHVWVSLNLLKA